MAKVIHIQPVNEVIFILEQLDKKRAYDRFNKAHRSISSNRRGIDCRGVRNICGGVCYRDWETAKKHGMILEGWDAAITNGTVVQQPSGSNNGTFRGEF